MKIHRSNASAYRRLVRGIWLKLALIAMVASAFVALPQMLSAHAGARPNVPQGFLFTVTTTDDHNDLSCDGDDCTLREAIDAANNTPTADTILFDVTGTINLTSVLPNIDDDVAIIGPGANLLTVRRTNQQVAEAFGIFHVTTTGTVTISGMTISNGIAPSNSFGGGGIRNSSSGTVNVTNCTISDNRAELGGAILNFSPVGETGAVNVTNSTISGNEADTGGGIFNNGTLNVTNSTISGNEAADAGGGIQNDFLFGSPPGTVNITNSTISDNSASRSGPGSGSGSGGGIKNSVGTVNVSHSTISNNRANNSGIGGGIHNRGGGTVTVTNSTIGNNKAISGPFGASLGGGIGNSAGTVNVTNSTISGSEADAGGGIFNSNPFDPNPNATVNVTNSTISDNRASAGAGIENDNGTVNVTNSTISRNFAAGFFGGGGGIENRSSGPATIKSSIIALNSAAGSGQDVSGAFTSQGFNLIGKTDDSTGFTASTDLTGTIASPRNPNLDPNGLQDNGGPTQTIALQPNSPAIDKGTSAGLTGALITDQRGAGFPRTFDDPAVAPATGGDNTDIGAFELQPRITAGDSVLINESCPPANGTIDPGERVTVNLELINNSNAATTDLVATLQSSGGLLAPSGPRSYGAIAVSGSAARDFSFTAEGSLISGQTITATLQLQDGAANLGTVSFNFTAGPTPCSFVRLVVTSTLSRANASTVTGAITVQNIGSVAANDVTLTTAKLGATNGTPLPQGLGNLAPGASASVIVNFNNSTPGSSSMLTAAGTYAGGTFSSSKRVTIP